GGLQHNRRAIGDDLRHRLPDLGAVEAHHHDAVGAHGRCVGDHSVDSVSAGLFEQLRVLGDLSARERAQPSHDVAAEPAAADNHPEDLALDLSDALAWHVLSRYYKHLSVL